MSNERRKHTRVPVQFTVAVIVESDEIPVKTWNLSLRGVGCTPDPRFTAQTACKIQFTLAPDTIFTIDGFIVRCAEKETGIYFTGMHEDAFYHLKRLVQYNTENPDIIDEELAGPVDET